MIKIDLSAIDNTQSKENFKELKREFDTNPLLKATFKFFAKSYTQAGTYEIPHGLRYKPRDIVITANSCGATIDSSIWTTEKISVVVASAGELRFLLGRID